MRPSRISIRGIIEVIERDARSGKLLTYYRGKNRVVDTGLILVADRVRGNTGTEGVSHYALGTDSTPPVGGQVSLLAEAYRAVLTQTRVSAGELKLTLHLGSSQGNGLTFREGGAFTPQNTMLCRGVYPDKAKTSLKELTVIHTILFAAS